MGHVDQTLAHFARASASLYRAPKPVTAILTECIGRVNMDKDAITDSQMACSLERELKARGLRIVESDR